MLATKSKLKYFNILVDAKAVARKEFTYSYDLNEKIRAGYLVKVPFHGRMLSGLVLAQTKKPPFKTKKIETIILKKPILDPLHFHLAEKVAKYYFTTLSAVIFVMLPHYLRTLKTGRTAKRFLLSIKKCPIISQGKEKKVKIKKFLLFDPEEKNTLEIYRRSIEKNLKIGKKVLLLVPDLSLPIVSEIKKIFGKKTAVFDPALRPTQDFELWLRVECNQFDVIIGSHRALFSHIHNLGLLIVHHEDDDLYKNAQKPRYHLVKVAEELAGLCGATLILQSPCPRIETYFNFKKDKQRRILRVSPDVASGRIEKFSTRSARSNSKIIDLRKENSLISFDLEQEIAQTISEKGKVLIFHNRKGFARFFVCQDCGQGGYLGPEEQLPAICPHCRSMSLRNASFGTERLEQDLKKIFPKTKIVRVEKDSCHCEERDPSPSNRRVGTGSAVSNSFVTARTNEMRTKQSQRRCPPFKPEIASVALGDLAMTIENANIIIGTSYVFKFNFPKFDLAAVILSELGLGLPDFRSSERVFRNLFKVATLGKRSIFQTYSPHQKVVRLAADKNYHQFYQNEIAIREKECFPPFRQLVRLILEGHDEDKVQKEISYLAGELRTLSADFPKSFDIFGPAKAFISPKNTYRYSMLLLGKNLYPALSIVPNNFKVDVDPVDLL